MVMLYVGVTVIAVGLIFMLFGLFVGWREAKKKGMMGPANDFIDSLRDLIRALADQPFSTVLFTFGILLIFLGGIIAGVGGLTQ